MFNRLFKTDRYTDILQQQQAGLIVGITLILVFGYTFYMAFLPSSIFAPRTALQYFLDTGNIHFFTRLGAFYVLGCVSLFILRQGNLRLASWFAFFTWCMLSVGLTIETGIFNGFNAVALLLTVLFGGLLVGRKGLWVALVITLISLNFTILNRANLSNELLPDYIVSAEALAKSGASDATALSFISICLAGVVALFLRYADIARSTGANEAIQIRTRVGDIVTDITQQVAQRISVQDLSEYTIGRIITDFAKIYHAQIFLTDETGAEARLSSSTGEVGKKLIERAHGLKVGSVSVIGQVTYLGKYIIAQSGSSDSVHQRNELLPETQVEAAFPLRIGNRVIGALDLQSKDREAFGRADLAQSFQTLADSIGLAIDNIRQFERAEQRVKENQRLVEEAREALRQVERLNERLTGRIWSDYINGAGREIGLAVDFESKESITQAELTESIAEAMKSQQLVKSVVDGQQVVTLPLRVRGRVVGAMEFELNEDGEFTAEDLDLLQEVGERFGVAIENVRLVNESQRTAQREAFVNQIVGRLQTMNNVEDMVTEAARGLRDALKAQKIAIKLGTPPR
ncbi:MAG TPA: GAF domain-containing protein [Aggregatilineales bacterium]|nr:GAF domain-containing protein [Aggregatilineales bacterium]